MSGGSKGQECIDIRELEKGGYGLANIESMLSTIGARRIILSMVYHLNPALWISQSDRGYLPKAISKTFISVIR